MHGPPMHQAIGRGEFHRVPFNTRLPGGGGGGWRIVKVKGKGMRSEMTTSDAIKNREFLIAQRKSFFGRGVKVVSEAADKLGKVCAPTKPFMHLVKSRCERGLMRQCIVDLWRPALRKMCADKMRMRIARNPRRLLQHIDQKVAGGLDARNFEGAEGPED